MNVKVSQIVESQVPRYLLKNRDLVEFLKNYYEWTEDSGNFQDVADRLADNFFLGYADEEFLEYFVTMLIPNFPKNTSVDRELLLKYSKEFYQSKGSERSIKFLLKAVFGVNATIYYPKVDIFRLSNTQFSSVLTMTVSSFDPLIAQMQARRIVGSTSGAKATVDLVTVGSPNSTIRVQDVVGTFVVGETISTEYVQGLDSIFSTVVSLPVASTVTTGDDSMASGTKKLQDGEYYQEFSYVIRTSIPDTVYGETIDRLAHPLGTKRIGEVV